jgi:outer membrane immunogenic protein
MKKFLLVCSVAFGALMTPAMAADMFVKAAPPAPAWSWTGFYIGGNAGYAWGDKTDPAISFVDPGTIGFAPYFNAGGNVFQSLEQGGFVGGGQVGYDWQFSQWVIGVVADYQGANVTDSRSASITPPGGFVTTTQLLSAKIDSLGTVRGRLGATAYNVLFYGTGGLAYGHVESTLGFFAPTAPLFFSGTTTSQNKTGWVAGLGVSYALTQNWNVGVEWLHYDLGSSTVTAVTVAPGAIVPGASISASQSFSGDLVRANVNFKFW